MKLENIRTILLLWPCLPCHSIKSFLLLDYLRINQDYNCLKIYFGRKSLIMPWFSREKKELLKGEKNLIIVVAAIDILQGLQLLIRSKTKFERNRKEQPETWKKSIYKTRQKISSKLKIKMLLFKFDIKGMLTAQKTSIRAYLIFSSIWKQNQLHSILVLFRMRCTDTRTFPAW